MVRFAARIDFPRRIGFRFGFGDDDPNAVRVPTLDNATKEPNPVFGEWVCSSHHLLVFDLAARVLLLLLREVPLDLRVTPALLQQDFALAFKSSVRVVLRLLPDATERRAAKTPVARVETEQQIPVPLLTTPHESV